MPRRSPSSASAARPSACARRTGTRRPSARSSTTITIAKPSQRLLKAELSPQAIVSSTKTTANTPNTAPAATAAAPRAMLVAFCVISALASSISSRTSTVIRSDTSVTAVARLSGCPLLPGKASEDHRQHESAGERGRHRDLGPIDRRRTAPGSAAATGWAAAGRRLGCGCSAPPRARDVARHRLRRLGRSAAARHSRPRSAGSAACGGSLRGSGSADSAAGSGTAGSAAACGRHSAASVGAARRQLRRRPRRPARRPPLSGSPAPAHPPASSPARRPAPLRSRGLGLLGHSGGSSPKTRIQIMLASRVATRLQRADAGEQPGPEQSLDQGALLHRRGFNQTSDARASAAGSALEAVADRLDDQRLGLLELVVGRPARLSKIQPLSTCSIEP